MNFFFGLLGFGDPFLSLLIINIPFPILPLINRLLEKFLHTHLQGMCGIIVKLIVKLIILFFIILNFCYYYVWGLGGLNCLCLITVGVVELELVYLEQLVCGVGDVLFELPDVWERLPVIHALPPQISPLGDLPSPHQHIDIPMGNRTRSTPPHMQIPNKFLIHNLL